MSKNPNAKTAQGASNYYPDVIFRQSTNIYWTDHISAGSNWGTDTTSAYTSVIPITIDSLTGGTDDYSLTAGIGRINASASGVIMHQHIAVATSLFNFYNETTGLEDVTVICGTIHGDLA